MSPWEPLLTAVRRMDIPPGSRVLIAVSGGADSVALLHALARVAPAQDWDLRVGHVNHGWRAEADADERFVVALARNLGIPAEVARVDTGTRSEAEAREARYASLEAMLARWKGDVIAVAHHADDQAETLLLHLARGAGPPGMAGMRERAGSVMRPFLSLPRATLVRALQAESLSWQEDASNQDQRYARNRLRHGVLPALEEIYPGAGRHLAGAARLARADDAYLAAETKRTMDLLDLRWEGGAVEGALGSYRALHPALQNRVAHAILHGLGAAEAEHVTALRAALLGPPGEIRKRWPGGMSLRVGETRFRLEREAPRCSFEAVSLPVPGVVEVPAGAIEATTGVDDLGAALAVCGPDHALLDAAQVGVLTVRPRRPGDRMHPMGAAGTRKVQDIMVDAGVPRHIRDVLPVVADERGPVWIPGLRLAQQAVITPATTRILHLRFRPAALLYRARMQGISQVS